MKIRNWKWWRLFTKIKPLLQIPRQDEDIKAKEEEISRLKAEMNSRISQVQEIGEELQKVQNDRNLNNERLTHLTEALVESDEVR
jgi:myosin protein heavy chain